MKYKKLFILLAAFTFISSLTPTQIEAANNIKGASAQLSSAAPIAPRIVGEDIRVKKLQAYLESYNSPLAPYAETFVKEADENNIDWRWVPAITGVESYFGQMIPPYSNNGWGFGVYGNNVRSFASWDEGIHVVTTALREEYMDGRGAVDIYQIGSTYAADPAWADKVQKFVTEIDQYTVQPDKSTLSISL